MLANNPDSDLRECMLANNAVRIAIWENEERLV